MILNDGRRRKKSTSRFPRNMTHAARLQAVLKVLRARGEAQQQAPAAAPHRVRRVEAIAHHNGRKIRLCPNVAHCVRRAIDETGTESAQ